MLFVFVLRNMEKRLFKAIEITNLISEDTNNTEHAKAHIKTSLRVFLYCRVGIFPNILRRITL